MDLGRMFPVSHSPLGQVANLGIIVKIEAWDSSLGVSSKVDFHSFQS